MTILYVFQGLYVATHVRMLQYSVAKPPQGAHPASSGLAGGGSGWRGAFVYAQYCPEHFPTTNTMQPRHCVGRGGPLATLGIMQGAAGDREGGGSVEGGTPGQHHLNQGGGAFEAGEAGEKETKKC